MMTFKSFIKGVWAFCSYVFVPQRRLTDGSRLMVLGSGFKVFDYIIWQKILYVGKRT